MNAATLQRLVDESDLRDLMQALPRALDEKNFDALAALFTEDGVHEIAGQIRRGRQAITDGPKGDLERLYEATYHHIGQIYVDLDGDEARIVAYIVAYHLPKAAEPMKHQDGGAKYHAVAQRTEDGWRLTRARHEIVFFQGEPMSFDVELALMPSRPSAVPLATPARRPAPAGAPPDPRRGSRTA